MREIDFWYAPSMNDKMRERVLWVLESIFRADPDVAHELVEFRVPVPDPEEMPDEVILLDDPPGDRPLKLGLIGVLNGVLGLEHRICGVYNDDGKLIGFKAHVEQPSRK